MKKRVVFSTNHWNIWIPIQGVKKKKEEQNQDPSQKLTQNAFIDPNMKYTVVTQLRENVGESLFDLGVAKTS